MPPKSFPLYYVRPFLFLFHKLLARRSHTLYNIYVAPLYGRALWRKWCEYVCQHAPLSFYFFTLRAFIPSLNPCGRDTPARWQYLSNIFNSSSVRRTSTRIFLGLSRLGRPLCLSGIHPSSLCQHIYYNLLPPINQVLYYRQ